MAFDVMDEDLDPYGGLYHNNFVRYAKLLAWVM